MGRGRGHSISIEEALSPKTITITTTNFGLPALDIQRYDPETVGAGSECRAHPGSDRAAADAPGSRAAGQQTGAESNKELPTARRTRYSASRICSVWSKASSSPASPPAWPPSPAAAPASAAAGAAAAGAAGVPSSGAAGGAGSVAAIAAGAAAGAAACTGPAASPPAAWAGAAAGTASALLGELRGTAAGVGTSGPPPPAATAGGAAGAAAGAAATAGAAGATAGTAAAVSVASSAAAAAAAGAAAVGAGTSAGGGALAAVPVVEAGCATEAGSAVSCAAGGTSGAGAATGAGATGGAAAASPPCAAAAAASSCFSWAAAIAAISASFSLRRRWVNQVCRRDTPHTPAARWRNTSDSSTAQNRTAQQADKAKGAVQLARNYGQTQLEHSSQPHAARPGSTLTPTCCAVRPILLPSTRFMSSVGYWLTAAAAAGPARPGRIGRAVTGAMQQQLRQQQRRLRGVLDGRPELTGSVSGGPQLHSRREGVQGRHRSKTYVQRQPPKPPFGKESSAAPLSCRCCLWHWPPLPPMVWRLATRVWQRLRRRRRFRPPPAGCRLCWQRRRRAPAPGLQQLVTRLEPGPQAPPQVLLAPWEQPQVLAPLRLQKQGRENNCGHQARQQLPSGSMPGLQQCPLPARQAAGPSTKGCQPPLFCGTEYTASVAFPMQGSTPEAAGDRDRPLLAQPILPKPRSGDATARRPPAADYPGLPPAACCSRAPCAAGHSPGGTLTASDGPLASIATPYTLMAGWLEHAEEAGGRQTRPQLTVSGGP